VHLYSSNKTALSPKGINFTTTLSISIAFKLINLHSIFFFVATTVARAQAIVRFYIFYSHFTGKAKKGI